MRLKTVLRRVGESFWWGAGCAACLVAALAAASVLATTRHAAAQGRIADTHGDWQIRCEQPVGAPSEQCALVQNVAAQDRANVSLTVLFLWTADRQSRILRVLAPLGVLLKPGMGLSIDGNEVGVAGFVRCRIEGCLIEVVLDDGLMERFQAGESATFVIFQTPEAGIGIPISLNGFSEGFAALDNPPPPPPAGAAEPDAAPAAPVLTETVDTPAGEEAGVIRTAAVEADDRTALDRLLEDDLLPLVAAVAVAIVLLLVVLFVLARRLSRRRKGKAGAANAERRQPRVSSEDGGPRARRAPDAFDDDEPMGPRRPRPQAAAAPDAPDAPDETDDDGFEEALLEDLEGDDHDPPEREPRPRRRAPSR